MRNALTVYIVSLGCPKNLVDTEVMGGSMAGAGFAFTDDPEFADVILINTCGFIEPARIEGEDEVRDALDWKQGRPGRKVVMSGCLVQKDMAQARHLFPEVDLLLTLNDVPNAGDLIRGLFRRQPVASAVTKADPATYLYTHETPRLLLTPGSHAYVKIAEGCNHICRFCTIPQIRGRQRSRPLDSITAECQNLLQQGVKELNLVAQDTTQYGSDLPGGPTLAELLNALETFDGDYWVRLLYTHPRHMTDDVIECLARGRHVLPYIDIPLQHISDNMLTRMGRRFNAQQTRELMTRLRTADAGIAIRTTFLVGFPGETEADFEELCEFAVAYQFDRLGVFPYSREPGTAAADDADQVPHDVAVERQKRLLELQQQIAIKHNASLIGRTMTVLADFAEGKGRYIGRTFADAPDVDNLVHFKGDKQTLSRGFNTVEITGASAYDLDGVLKREAPAGGRRTR